LKSSPDDAEAHYELGLLYERMGRAADAVRAFERALELTRSQELEEAILKSLRGVNR
jgi:Flp pilus assembly protein TadD